MPFFEAEDAPLAAEALEEALSTIGFKVEARGRLGLDTDGALMMYGYVLLGFGAKTGTELRGSSSLGLMLVSPRYAPWLKVFHQRLDGKRQERDRLKAQEAARAEYERTHRVTSWQRLMQGRRAQ